MRMLDRKYEPLPAAELEQLQLERLQALIVRVRRNVRRYRETLGEARVTTLSDVQQLPVTTPDDLLTAFPYGMFALPLREVIRLHSAVGPDGRQIVIGHTRNDLTNWGRLTARQLSAAGVTAHDVIQICFEAGTLPGTAGYVLGAERIEASVIAEDPFHIEYQLAMLQNYRATVLITTPSNAAGLVRLLASRRVDPQSLSLRAVLLSRPVPASEREALRAGLFADIRCSFGVPEILDPGLCVECASGRLHVNEDHFLVEVKDGELLVSTLCREAMPLLRYRTRIACEIRREKCPCGRTGAVLLPGERLDDRLRVNEKPLYRSQIAGVLARTGAAGRAFDVDILEDKVLLRLALTADLFSDTMRTLFSLKQEIESEFFSRLGILTEVRFVEPRGIPHKQA